MKELVISSRTIERRQNFVNKSREQSIGNTGFPELTQAAQKDTKRVKTLLKSIGSNFTEQVKGLSPTERASFVTELSDYYREHVSNERSNNLFLGRLIRNGTIPQNCVNPDGTFDVTNLQSVDYFQQNPHMIDILDLRTRQLSKKSKTRQKATLLADQDIVASFEPTKIQEETTEKSFPNVDHEEAHGHGHGHGHGHTEEKSKHIISRKWQAATIAGNAIIGAAELITGGGSTLSVTADGLHNAGDAGTYYLQTENILNPHLSERRIERRRKISHAIIAGLSVAAATKAGYDIQSNDEFVHNPMTLYAAGASLALNTMLMTTLYRGINRRRREGRLEPHEKDLTKHLWAIDIPSATLAVGGAVAQRYGVGDLEQIAAILSGLRGAYVFRPTAKNLEHNNCVKHDHSHHKDKADNLPLRPRPIKRTRRLATAAVLVAALGAGMTGAGKQSAPQESKTQTGQSTTTADLLNLPSVNVPNITRTAPSLATAVQIPQGISQWELAADSIKDAGVRPTNALTNPVTNIIAFENSSHVKNPDNIEAGETLRVPTKEVIIMLNKAVTSSPSLSTTTEGRQFVEDVQELNHTKPMTMKEKMEKKKPVLKRIKKFLSHLTSAQLGRH